MDLLIQAYVFSKYHDFFYRNTDLFKDGLGNEKNYLFPFVFIYISDYNFQQDLISPPTLSDI